MYKSRIGTSDGSLLDLPVEVLLLASRDATGVEIQTGDSNSGR